MLLQFSFLFLMHYNGSFCTRQALWLAIYNRRSNSYYTAIFTIIVNSAISTLQDVNDGKMTKVAGKKGLNYHASRAFPSCQKLSSKCMHRYWRSWIFFYSLRLNIRFMDVCTEYYSVLRPILIFFHPTLRELIFCRYISISMYIERFYTTAGHVISTGIFNVNLLIRISVSF